MRRSLALVVVLAVTVGAGCDSGADGAAPDCRGLADRWVTLQQRVLDAADDPLADPVAASLHAAATIEQARDATAVGCGEEMAVGSALICERVDLLQPRGLRGFALVADLRSACSQR